MNCDFAGKWDEISGRGYVAGRFRVCPDHLLNMFVGFSAGGWREFTLEFLGVQLNMETIPTFENINIRVQDVNGLHSLILQLRDRDLSDLFSNICSDLAEGSSAAVTSESAVHIFIARLNRWADLLRRGRNDELSFIERLGLLGELCVLSWMVTECSVQPSLAVRGWRGPEADTNDIGVNNLRVEVKAQLSTQRKSLRISSLDQLGGDGNNLFLAVNCFSPSEDGVSLESLISSIISRLDIHSKGGVEFQRKLVIAGYDPNAAYAKEKFKLEEMRIYHVIDGFPKLVPSNVPIGVSKVKYEVECEAIRDFMVPSSELKAFFNA
ncbi:PD-(D/E)XK motif protein [Pseudomonas sp. SLFW]|uniref:PD-(D/E)XK motif protein n=1 Tax=Pseudomonas sp. SLFW TaxID=2683259 RepID=UPI0014121187|nr:PD-(D/E)XK motif protein [Pseudomonas sp. SLFW]NBB12535.1 PD-(D/E)XK motif protein [Pseudomonas sp. SLFW]